MFCILYVLVHTVNVHCCVVISGWWRGISTRRFEQSWKICTPKDSSWNWYIHYKMIIKILNISLWNLILFPNSLIIHNRNSQSTKFCSRESNVHVVYIMCVGPPCFVLIPPIVFRRCLLLCVLSSKTCCFTTLKRDNKGLGLDRVMMHCGKYHIHWMLLE